MLALLMPLKAGLFFILLTRFKLRARTSLLASLSLSNYSEFGLIVCTIGVANGWVSGEWLVIIAIALSITFVMAAPLNSFAHNIYARLSGRLRYFETAERLPEAPYLVAMNHHPNTLGELLWIGFRPNQRLLILLRHRSCNYLI